jgi:hypothetical protein
LPLSYESALAHFIDANACARLAGAKKALRPGVFFCPGLSQAFKISGICHKAMF